MDRQGSYVYWRVENINADCRKAAAEASKSDQKVWMYKKFIGSFNESTGTDWSLKCFEFPQKVPRSLDELVQDLNVWALEPLHISVVVSNHL